MNINSKVLRALAVILLFLAGMMAYAASTGQLTVVVQNIGGALAVPFQKVNAAVSGGLSNWADRNLNIDNIMAENESLKEELNQLRQKQVDYNRLKIENEQYQKLHNIKDTVENYELITAGVIGRDGIDNAYSFKIDQGTNSGIEVDDVVISAEGVVGVVVETGINFSKVATILSPSVSLGCLVGESLDVGIASGNFDLGNSDKCVVEYLPKDTRCKKGDIVSTSGYGEVFPKDLIVGTVEETFIDTSGNYMCATVTPAVDISAVKVVFVITDYK